MIFVRSVALQFPGGFFSPLPRDMVIAEEMEKNLSQSSCYIHLYGKVFFMWIL